MTKFHYVTFVLLIAVIITVSQTAAGSTIAGVDSMKVNPTPGPYDIIVKLSDDNTDMIKESIGKHMTRIGGIESTLTLMAE